MNIGPPTPVTFEAPTKQPKDRCAYCRGTGKARFVGHEELLDCPCLKRPTVDHKRTLVIHRPKRRDHRPGRPDCDYTFAEGSDPSPPVKVKGMRGKLSAAERMLRSLEFSSRRPRLGAGRSGPRARRWARSRR